MRKRLDQAPSFYLYGEVPRHVDAQFLHLETIEDRSAPVGGHIRPHKHEDLNHIFLFESGSGRVVVDDQDLYFSGPHLLFIPSGVVHGFTFGADVVGYVLTVAGPYLRDLLQSRVGLGDYAKNVDLLTLAGRGALGNFRRWVLRLNRELVWQAPAHRAAIEANLIGLLVDMYRQSIQRGGADTLAPHVRLVGRFHGLIEAHYRGPTTLTDYLVMLRVTEAQLRYACERAGEGAPMQMVLKRRLIEARRLLIYSDLTIAECCASLGFGDAAYFSRTFAKATGLSPRAYRQSHRAS